MPIVSATRPNPTSAEGVARTRRRSSVTRMGTMSMNKAIHGAVRRDLTRFQNALATFAEGDTSRAEALGRAWDNFEDQLEHHHTGEHEIAWPALRQLGISEELIAGMDAEHDAMQTALDSATSAMIVFRASAAGQDAAAAAEAIAKLETVANAHLEHEEAELEPVFDAERENPIIKEMGKKFGQVSPTRGGRFFAWVQDGAAPEERAAITESVPGPVLAIIGGIFGRGYRKSIAPIWER